MKHIEINKVSDKVRSLYFYHPVTGTVEQNDGMFVVSIPEANIYAVGESIGSCVDTVCEDLFFVWDVYAKENDENMTDDAIRIKQYMLSVAEETDA